MGFFSDLKEDLSQAVNELIPEEEVKEASEDAVKEEAETAEAATAQDTPEWTAEAEDTKEEVSEELSELEAMLERVDSIEIPDEPEDEDMAALEELLDGAGEPEEETVTEKAEEAVPVMEEIKEEKTINKTDWGGMKMDMQMKNVSDETAVITAGMTITGDIESEGSMEVIGTINGNINILGKLNITGVINGNSQAEEIYADNAKINGEINSEGAVKIGQSSVVIGNIFAASAVIAGAVKGDIDVKGPVILDTSAIVMGNIKSKAVQINNGAVIEGMCSQCYADVNPTSFFEDLKNK